MLRTIKEPKIEDETLQTKVLRWRLGLYIFILLVQSVNFWHTFASLLEVLPNEPKIQLYFPYWYMFLTVWTVVVYEVNAVIGLICDSQELRNVDKAKGKFVNYYYLRSFKNTFFNAIVFPMTWVCLIMFWFFYFYDKNIINMPLIEKFGSDLNSHIGHTLIGIAVICEASLLSDKEPKSHARNVLYGLSCLALYILLLRHIFFTSGIWLYPFYEVAYGTIYFPVIILSSSAIIVVSYFSQWPIRGIAITKGKRE